MSELVAARRVRCAPAEPTAEGERRTPPALSKVLKEIEVLRDRVAGAEVSAISSRLFVRPKRDDCALAIIVRMGRVRRAGYIFEWWVGDHPPRNVHVYDSNGHFLGRITIATLRPLDDWMPPRIVVSTLQDLVKEGRL